MAIKVERLAEMTPERRFAILARSTVDLGSTMEATCGILDALRADPEAELKREYASSSEQFGVTALKVTDAEIEEAASQISPELMEALARAKKNIERFHQEQLERPLWMTEISPGLWAGRMTKPLETVGVYIPGGRASYPSSALMNIIPAVVAGVERGVAVTPPDAAFKARPRFWPLAGWPGLLKFTSSEAPGPWGAWPTGLAGFPKSTRLSGLAALG